MFAEGRIELTELIFNPEESIRFNMDHSRQTTVVQLTNNEKFDVFFKWKSNRLSVYKIIPNSCVVKAKATQTFVMMCKGESLEQESSPPRDRISAIISRIKPTTLDVKQIWKFKKSVFEGKAHKKIFFVVYNGANLAEWWNRDMKGNMEPERQPTFGLAEDDDTPAIAAAIRNGNLMHVLVPLESPKEEDGSSEGGSKENS